MMCMGEGRKGEKEKNARVGKGKEAKDTIMIGDDVTKEREEKRDRKKEKEKRARPGGRMYVDMSRQEGQLKVYES